MNQKPHDELIGEFDLERIAFQEDDPDNRTIIGELRDRTTIKGKAGRNELSPGITYKFWGNWTTHPRYGKQFHFSSFCITRPVSEEGLRRYLAQCRGIGLARARDLIKVFGQEVCDVLRQRPQDAADQVKGLSVDVARAAGEMLAADALQEDVIAELMGILAGHGFRKSLPKMLVGAWGLGAPGKVRAEPYSLLAFPGVGFLLADRLYLELGLDPAAVIRQGMCLWCAIHSDNEGHVWFPLSVAEAYLRKSIAVQTNPEAALDWAVENGRLVSRVQDGRVWVADARLAAHEANIVSRLAAAERETPHWPMIEGTEEDGRPTCHQGEQLQVATQGKIGVLAGGPGTGKTFSTGALIRACGMSPDKTLVCAPTGKAAVRITESLAAQGVEITARTIHSSLGAMTGDNGWGFTFNAANPLPHDWIVVDEASMIDVPLLSALLDARGDAHILFVGDPDQLSPVGPGAPLRDLIAAGVPCGRLTETRRNAGQIVESCKSIRDHQKMQWSAGLNLETGHNLIHVELDTPSEQIEEVFRSLSLLGGLDPVWDCQILAAVNEKSLLGRVPLNKLLQGRLNPTGEQVAGNEFRVGDKIICTRNGDVPLLEEAGRRADQDAKTRVANGELARVVKVTSTYTEAVVFAPERRIRIPKGRSEEDGDTGCNWELGYVISTHKSQGSEWPVVLILIDSYPGAVRLCDKHWLYTAISRPRLYGVTIGKRSIAEGMVRKSHMWKRKTFLREDLEELRLSDCVFHWERGLKEISDGSKENECREAAEAEESHRRTAGAEARRQGD